MGGHVCACVSDPVLHIGDLYQGGDHDLYNRVRGQLRRKKSPVVVSHMLSCSSTCTDVAVCTQATRYRGLTEKTLLVEASYSLHCCATYVRVSLTY